MAAATPLSNPPPPDRRQHEVDLWAVGKNLQPACTLAGDDCRVVVGRDDGVAMLRGERLGAFPAFGARRPYGHNLRAQRRGGSALDLGRVRGHDDDGANAKRARGVGHALPVIAARIADDPTTPLGLAQLCNGIGSAAQFEAADRLQALRLQIRCCVGDRRQTHQGRMQDHIAEPVARGGKLFRGDKLSPCLNIRSGHIRARCSDLQNDRHDERPAGGLPLDVPLQIDPDLFLDQHLIGSLFRARLFERPADNPLRLLA